MKSFLSTIVFCCFFLPAFTQGPCSNPTSDFHFKQDVCNPLTIQFFSDGANVTNPQWDFGDGNTASGVLNPNHTYAIPGNYTINFNVLRGSCRDYITKTINVNTLTADIVLTPDTTICSGTTAQLRAKPALSYCWSPTTYLNNPNSITPISSTPQNIIYYYTAETTGANLITNGDFNNGNTDINSQYQYSSSGLLPGVYFVGTNPTAWRPGMSACKDHTTGTGNMLLINGAQQANVVVWSQQITVTPNTNYAFSAWLQHVTTINPAILQFSINGIPIGNVFQANSTSCIWDRFYAVWNSGNNTTATISILNQNTGFSGNDFALDDIEFAELKILRDSVKVNVAPKPQVDLGPDKILCSLSSMVLDAGNAGAGFLWQDGSTQQTFTANSFGKYYVRVTNTTGCVNSDTITLTKPSTIREDFHFKQDMCNPLTVQFLSDGSNLTNPQWDFGDGNTLTGVLNPVHTYTSAGNYPINFSVQGGSCSGYITKTISVNTLTADIVLTPDTAICSGSTAQLRAKPALSYCWSPTTYLNNPNSITPVTSTPQNIIYYYTAEMTGANLITNGDFNNGNTDINSQYQYSSSGLLPGVYFVGTNPTAWHPGMSACKDHTTGTGNMLLINGAQQANVVVWSQQVTVTPNTNYAFSAWLQHMTTLNPAILQFSINGIPIGNTFQANSVSCIWDRFYAVWNSGSNTTATISILNQNTGFSGNDFALDDIEFAELKILRDSVKVNVLPKPVVDLGPDKTFCSVSNLVLDAGNAGAGFLWQDGSTQQTFTANSFGKYYVRVTSATGCMNSDTIILSKASPIPADFQFKQDICDPLKVQFTGTGTGLLNPYWSFGDGNTSTGNFTVSHTYPAYANYTVKFGIEASACKDTITKVISIQLTNSNLILTPDTTICFNSTKQLRTQPGALDFCWSPVTYLDNPNAANPVTSTPQKMTYYYTAQMTGANLITNGDFNNGNTDINSKYQYSSSGLLPGVYFVGKDPAAWHPGMSACKDHTTGTGNMLLINGAQQANVVVWSQQVTVTPNTNYAFSAWLQHVTTINPAILQFSINGIPIGNVFQANSTSCIWDRFYTAWNSGNNTTAIISILNQNTGFSGNDFALDDISFAPVFIQRDSVIISVDTPFVQANMDTTICLNGQIQLQATGGATWSWTPATGLNNTAISNPVATPAVNTNYIVTAQTSHGCIAKDTVAVRLFPIPTIITNHDTTVCANTPVQLAANNNLMTYAWTPAATLDNATIANPVAMPGRNTIYKVQVTDAYKCSYTDSVNVTMRRIRFGAILGKTICQGTSTILRAMGGDRYQWSPAGSLSDASIAAPVATPDTTTYYRVNISESHCGTDTTITVWVKVNPMPVVKAEKINDIDCLIHSAKLKASGSAGSSYLWAPNRGLDFPTLPEPICSADSTITYFVTSTNQYGCSALDSVTVYVTATNKASFEVPNAFTPNGDGVNDCFGLKSWGGATIEEFSIFSRWGERVFTTNKQGTCWDGRFRGESLPSGGYPYIIKAKTPCGYIKRTGIVMLIR